MEQRLDALNTADKGTGDLPYKAKAAVIETVYVTLFAPLHSRQARQALKAIESHDLDPLFGAAYVTAFYTIDQAYAKDMALALDELQTRGLATKEHYMHMSEMFLKTRMLAEANELARQHPLPELPAVPALHEASGLASGQPTELAVDPNTHELLRRAVDVHQPAQIVAVTSPICHFSQDATHAIEADPELSNVFRAHATWLAPQDAVLDLEIFQRWNREHAGKEATWAFRRDEWPMIDNWGTPTFYFMENGVVRAKVTGWPDDRQLAKLRAALQQIRLLP